MFHKQLFIGPLHQLYRRGLAPLRRSKFLARRLFGVGAFGSRRVCYWDWVTLCLRKALRNEDWQGRSFLDLGCGSAAILSVFAYRRGCRSITAVDVVPELVAAARDTLRVNAVEADVLQSDLGENLSGETFDVIAFNSPYIPEFWGNSQNVDRDAPTTSHHSAVTWSGGEDGTASIRRFLQEMPRFLSRRGRILLGYNRFYVGTDHVRSIVREQQLLVQETITLPLVPPVVLSIRPQ